MFQYSMEVGYVDDNGNAHIDEYVLSDRDRNYVIDEYLKQSLEFLTEYFEREAFDDVLYVFKRIVAEKIDVHVPPGKPGGLVRAGDRVGG